jgi:hypothetical protein
MYELPTISELQHKLPTKLVWKQEIKKQIHNHWTKRLIDEAGAKSSLKFLDIIAHGDLSNYNFMYLGVFACQ